MPEISRRHTYRRPALAWLVAATFILILFTATTAVAGDQPPGYFISGRLHDAQGQPVTGAEVAIYSGEGVPAPIPQAAGGSAAETTLASTQSQSDGSWTLRLATLPPEGLTVAVNHPHFQPQVTQLDAGHLDLLRTDRGLELGETILDRRVTPAFWAATAIFLGMLLIIALERLHSTTAALAGLSAVFVVSYAGQVFAPGFFIFTFQRALTYINWEVIFLVMAMMIIIAIIEGTGVFQWAAFQAYRLSRGHAWLLALILMLLTAFASALLDNFTTMLLMVPISMQIGLALGINPLALIIPEVLASNVAGISTLIGTPTNILIGAYAGIGFSDFLINQTIGVVLALAIVAAFALYYYRAEWRKSGGGISARLYERLAENARIEDSGALWRSGLVFALVLVGFVVGDRYEIVPAVPALVGATILLVWLQPNIHTMISAVDWTTLVFFMALFMVVGAVQEVGLISFVAQGMGQVVGQNLVLGLFIVIFASGTLSLVITNIPLAASLLPVVEFLSGSIPSASNKALYYALSMGAAMGGNGLLISGEANLVTAGITEQAGTPISFAEFLKIGLPITYLTLVAGFLWLLLHFVIF